MPAEIDFATKPQIALEQIRAAKAAGVPAGVVLADSGYGNSIDFRESSSRLGLKYCVGVQPSTTVWTAERAPLPPKISKSGRGRPATRVARARGHEPFSVKKLAFELPRGAWRTLTWRQGSNAPLRSRFAAVLVRAAHRDWLRSELRDEEWLLIDWPESEPEPVHYWLSTLPAIAKLRRLARTAMTRWRIERDYQELKQEFGLSHYEGRGWRGFHHHASLCIAAYGFLLARRLKSGAAKKTPLDHKRLSYPRATRRAAAGRMQRHVPNSIATLRFLLARAILRQLDRCPACARAAAKPTL